jgi:hypothetical protein
VLIILQMGSFRNRVPDVISTGPQIYNRRPDSDLDRAAETVSELPNLLNSCYEDYHFPGSQALPGNQYLPGSAR